MRGSIVILLLFLISNVTFAKDNGEFEIKIENHMFIPDELNVPAHTKLKLIIKNLDDTAEEFESFDLRREKIVLPFKEVIVYVNPLEPGEYKFFGEFHQKTAQGKIIAKEIK